VFRRFVGGLGRQLAHGDQFIFSQQPSKQPNGGVEHERVGMCCLQFTNICAGPFSTNARRHGCAEMPNRSNSIACVLYDLLQQMLKHLPAGAGLGGKV
jgi:hypothetical protein